MSESRTAANDMRRALKASRVVPLTTANPHGPLGLEQLAAEVGALRGECRFPAVVVPLSPELWDKLQRLAEAAGRDRAEPVTAAGLVRDIVERYLAGQPS
jgi:hypothetical protein